MAGQRPYLAKQHKLKFAQWLQEKLIGVNTGCRLLDLLAMGPSATVSKYQAYEINAYNFTQENNTKKSVDPKLLCEDGGYQQQRLEGDTLWFHRRDLGAQLWTIDNRSMQVPVSPSSKKGVITDKYGMVVMDLANITYQDKSFVLAKDVVQVFYAPNLANVGKHVALQSKRKIVGVEDRTEEDGGFQDMPLLGPNIELPVFKEGKKPAYVRTDHESIAPTCLVATSGASLPAPCLVSPPTTTCPGLWCADLS